MAKKNEKINESVEKLEKVKESVDTKKILDMIIDKTKECSEECDCCADDIMFPCVLEEPPFYDFNAFQKGVNSVSEICGIITALTNVGIEAQSALEFVLAREAMTYEMKAVEISSDTQKEVSKNVAVQAEKQSI